jgi:hypothetical protein
MSAPTRMPIKSTFHHGSTLNTPCFLVQSYSTLNCGMAQKVWLQATIPVQTKGVPKEPVNRNQKECVPISYTVTMGVMMIVRPRIPQK